MENVQDTARAWGEPRAGPRQMRSDQYKIRHHLSNKNKGFSNLTCRVAKSCEQCEATSDRARRREINLSTLAAPDTIQ
jgi:hypothetical protein